MYGMSMEEKDMLTLNELADKYKISGLMSILYWNIVRKRNSIHDAKTYSSYGRELTDLANMIDDLEQFANKIGE